MSENVVPDATSAENKGTQVEKMFDSISPRYDLLNRIMTFGIDRNWRKNAVEMLRPLKPRRILDIATGTADFAIEALRLDPEQVIGIDISNRMMDVGRQKIEARHASKIITLQTASAESMPFADESFDAITIGYGVRNFENLDKGIDEIYRVLRKGGALVILETSQPDATWKKIPVNLYTRILVPALGRLISRNDIAYKYLINSAQKFPYGEAFVGILKKHNFTAVVCKPLFFGVSSIYYAEK